jgi:hypothetical protein
MEIDRLGQAEMILARSGTILSESFGFTSKYAALVFEEWLFPENS